MKTKTEYLAILKQFKEKAADKYGILKIGIFGSVARDEQTADSDLDVCIEVKVDIRDELEQLCKCKVDLVRLRAGMSHLFQKNIERDGIFA